MTDRIQYKRGMAGRVMDAFGTSGFNVSSDGRLGYFGPDLEWYAEPGDWIYQDSDGRLAVQKSILSEDIKIGEHCWALSLGKLLIAMKSTETRYEVCGAWECGLGSEELEILEVIPRPTGHEAASLYYGQSNRPKKSGG